LLTLPANCIGIKAKTLEGMGTDNAAIAHAVVLLQSSKKKSPRKKLR
jgi:2C-methyl-D-erythritol 2,4-cyclodiphosphate synthase